MNIKTKLFSKKPLVSAWIMTYNQEDYIAQAIESILSQECSYPAELVIGDDASTDRTSDICNFYSRKYAPKINYIRYATNSPNNYFNTVNYCKGKYIAMCEGDDFWTRPDKLEKQVSFLELNSDYTLVSSKTLVINETDQTSRASAVKEGSIKFNDLLRSNALGEATCATVFRKHCLSRHAIEFINGCPYGDWATWLVCLSQGQGFVLEDQFGAYRRHPRGIYSSQSSVERATDTISMYKRIMSFLPQTTQEMLTFLSEYEHPLHERNLDKWGHPLPKER